uniref:SEA domain-containing protein n=1 Tax=Capra hircus TaxID=9925 RepID=A0A8C2SC30_CAPHI
MTPDIQAPFSLLLLFQVLTVLTASVPTSPSSTVQVSSTQSSPTSSPTKETSLSVQVSLFFLSFRIINLQFNSSLENPQTSYYQELKRSILDVVVCQCGRKKCEQLDIFPTLDAYHPMSEYSAYHTHGRFVPPGSTKRSPYEEVSAGNGGSNLSYTNLAATSANL